MLLAAAVAGLAYLAGAAAPDAVGNSVKGAVIAAKQRLVPATTPAVAASAAGAASAPGPASASTAASPASAAASGATPTAVVSVPMGSILLPTLVPGTGTYALQAGQFGSQAAAEELSASINGRGVISTVIVTAETGTTTWAVVAIGRFSNPAEAWSQRTYYANKLGLPPDLVPIVLPPPSKPPS